MQPGPPLDYEPPRVTAPPTRNAKRRRTSARIVVIAWLATAGGAVFAFFHTDDRNPLQMPSVVFMLFAGLYASIMTLYHWVVLVPMLRARERR